MTAYFTPRRVVAIAAHPDDLEFGCAGTLALWAAQGAYVVELLVTSGEKGFTDDRPEAEKRAIREREQQAAARIVGAAAVRFLRLPDGEVENTPALRREIVRVLREERPDTVVAYDPANLAFDNFYRYHPDHRATALAAFDALYPAAGNRHFFPELLAAGLAPHRVAQVFFAGPTAPNTWIDISATIDRKVAALRAHASQVGDADDLEAWIRERAAELGRAKGLRYAETFRWMEVPE